MQSFKEIQYEFAKHLRDPNRTSTPQGIEERRIKVYRELFFGNIKGLVSTTFPVLQKFYSKVQWERLIRKFMIEHESKTPLFLEVSGEFIEYLQNTYEPAVYDPPFMFELAHYEWAELVVSVMDEDVDLDTVNQNGDLLNEVPFVSPAIWSLVYEFPVHTIRPDNAPTEKPEQPTFLLVFRKLDDSVEFMELNAVSARLIELLEEGSGKTGQALLLQIAEEMQHPNPQAVVDGGLGILEQFKQKEVILGTLR